MSRSNRSTLSAAVALALAGTACTIVVHDGKTGNDGGKTRIEPYHAQVLWLVNLDRSAVNLASADEALIRGLEVALAANKPSIVVDELGVAPLNRRTSGGARLLFGESVSLPGTGTVPVAPGGPGGAGPASSLAQTLAQAASGSFLLDADAAAPEQANLAELGLTLGTQVRYDPTGGDPAARPVFTQPRDLFIVATLSHLRRRCAAGDDGCRLAGKAPAAYFTSATDGKADWLVLGGGARLPLSRIFHVDFVTAEGADTASFWSRCGAVAGFPSGLLDLMEPSAAVYYGPLGKAVDQAAPGRSLQADLCAMLGSSAPLSLKSQADDIAGAMAELP